MALIIRALSGRRKRRPLFFEWFRRDGLPVWVTSIGDVIVRLEVADGY